MGFGPFNPFWNMDPAKGRGIIGPGMPQYDPRIPDGNASFETPNLPTKGGVQDRIQNRGVQGEDRRNRMQNVMGGIGGMNPASGQFVRKPLQNKMGQAPMPGQSMMPQMPQMNQGSMNPMNKFGSVMGGIPRMM